MQEWGWVVVLAKATESLAVAEEAFAAGHFNSCASRSYYACFQAAIAALIHEGIWPRGDWTHVYVSSRFAGQLIDRRHLFTRELRDVLTRSFRIRVIADYSLPQHVTPRQAQRSVERARAFVGAVQERFRDH